MLSCFGSLYFNLFPSLLISFQRKFCDDVVLSASNVSERNGLERLQRSGIKCGSEDGDAELSTHIAESSEQRRLAERYSISFKFNAHPPASTSEQSKLSAEKRAAKLFANTKSIGLFTSQSNAAAKSTDIPAQLPCGSNARPSSNYWTSLGRSSTVAVRRRQWMCFGRVHLGSTGASARAGKQRTHNFCININFVSSAMREIGTKPDLWQRSEQRKTTDCDRVLINLIEFSTLRRCRRSVKCLCFHVASKSN